jgi:hypothetical protein
MLREIELHFGGDESYLTIHPVEVTCGTELMNLAYAMQRAQRADGVSFGPVIDRDSDGLPAYSARR